MSKAIAFLAGMGAGYLKQKDKNVDDARQAARDKREQDTFDATMRDRAQTKADKDALRVAGAPVAVTETAPAGPVDAGSDIPAAAAPIEPVAKAGSRSFASRGIAEAEAAKMNTPQGTRARTMTALSAQGNAVGADQLRTSGIQADAAQAALDKGKRDEANAVFDLGVKEALQRGGPDALATFMSESHADGAGGKAKFKAVTQPDGKWQIHQVNEDGTTAPIGRQSYTSDDQGYATAGMLLARAVPEKDKVAHFTQLSENKRKADHDAAQLKIAQQNADTQEKYRKDQAENMRQQRALESQRIAALTAKAAAPGAPIRLDLKDMRDFEGDLSTHIKEQFPVKDGASPEERAATNAEATKLKAMGNALFQTNAQAGTPLVAATVLQALELAKTPANVRIFEVGGVKREGVIVNGQPVITSGAVMKASVPTGSATPQPVATPPGTGQNQANVPTPAAAARQGVAAPAAPVLSPDYAAALKPQADQLRTLQQALVQAGQSGDQRAIAAYAAQVNTARQKLQADAVSKLGPDGAGQFMSTLSQ